MSPFRGDEVGVVAITGLQGQLRRGRQRIAEIAARQHGVIARQQLLDLGASAKQVRHLIATGSLHPINRGVYAVGHAKLSREGRCMAAVLAGGPSAVLSHHSAAALHKLIEHPPSLPHITSPTKGLRRPHIHIHSARLPRDELTIRDEIPTTTVPRTIIDLAARLDAFALERLMAEAHFRGHRDPRPLERLIARYPRRRGLTKLRGILATGHHTLGPSRSPLEDRFLRFLDARGLERPEQNRRLRLGGRTIKPDCMWGKQRVIVELDGRDAHLRERTWQDDRLRDRRLLAEGWKPARITSEQLERDPDGLEADLRELGVGDRLGA